MTRVTKIFNKNVSAGYTMVEVLASLFIFTTVVGAITPGFIYNTKYNSNSEVKTGAVQAAQTTLDQIRLLDPTTLPTSGSVTTTNVSGGERTYTVVTTYCATSSLCVSTETRDLKVAVSYRGSTVYTTETVFTKLR